ncbi:MAG: PAS domain S-box protein [Actinomycetota bacterium]|nr:PAS domain S-box protein [Actinomycetota bacterium]
MKDERKSRGRLSEEIEELRRSLSEYEAADSGHGGLSEALEGGEESFLGLANSLPVAVAIYSENRVVYVNPSFEQQLGYSREELLDKDYTEFIHPDFVPFLKQRGFARSRGEEVPFRFEFKVKTKSGEDRWADATSALMEYGGKPAVIVTAFDITERKLMEEELRKSEKRFYSSILEKASEALMVLDADGIIRYVSPSVKGMLGMSPRELSGKTPLDFFDRIDPDEVERVAGVFRDALQDPGSTRRVEFQAWGADGSWRDMEVTGTNLLDDPEVSAVVASMRDITESKLAAKALESANREKEAILSSMSEQLIYHDRDMKIIWANRVAAESVGMEIEEMVDGRCHSIWHGRDQVCEGCPVKETLETGEPREGEITGPDGRIWSIKGYPVKDGDEVMAAVEVAVDITESKLAEKALRESESYYRSLIENSYDLVSVLNPDGSHRYISPSVKRIVGYDAEEMMRIHPFDLIHPEDRPGVLEDFRNILEESEHAVHLVYRIRHKDGTWRVLETVARGLFEEPGVEGVVVNSRDITESKLAEEELRRSEEYFRSLIEHTLDVIVVLDREGNVRYLSSSFERVLGYRPQEVVEGGARPSIHPDDAVGAEAGMRFVLENPGELYSTEIRCRHADGSWRTLEVRGSNLLGEPSVGAIVANFSDVTEGRLMRDKLESINQLFLGLGADLMENIDRIVHTAGEILDGSLAVYARVDQGRMSMLSTAPGEESFRVTDRPKDCPCHELIERGTHAPLFIGDLASSRYAELNPDIGKYGLVCYLGYPVEREGKVMGCLGLYDDKAREFSADEIGLLGTLARAIAIEEERLSHEEGLKDFIDVASHELRHPVTIMKGYATSLKKLWGKLDQEQIKEMLEAINSGSDRMNKLVLELLDVSRIERGRFSVDKKAMHLGPILDRVVEEMRDKGAPHEFSTSIAAGLDTMRADSEKLSEAILIMLDNAVNFSPAGTAIEIEAAYEDGEAVVSVLDRGDGVPENARERIFERFYQVEEALHHSKPGIGLGLYIAREIAEGHGGRMWYEPREGGGSAFRLALPM